MSVLEKIMFHRKVKLFATLFITLWIFISIALGYTVVAEENSQQTQTVSVQSEDEKYDQTLTDDSMMSMNTAEKVLIVLLGLIILVMLSGSIITIITMLHKQIKINELSQETIDNNTNDMRVIFLSIEFIIYQCKNNFF